MTIDGRLNRACTFTTGCLRRGRGAFAFKTGLDLCVCKANSLGASLGQDLKEEIPS
jgi:hypothetical protein